MRRKTRYSGIVELGPNYFQVRVQAGKDPLTGRYKEKAENVRGTLSEARARQNDLMSAVANRKVAIGDWTVGKLVTEYLDHVEGKNAITTVKYDRLRWGRLEPRVGNLKVRKTTARDFDQVLDDLQREGDLKPQTVNRYRALLSSAFRKGVAWGVAVENPIAGTTARTEEPYNPEMISDESIRFVLAAMATYAPKMSQLLTLTMMNSLRRGEAVQLQARDYDSTTQTLWVRRAADGAGGDKDVKNHQGRLVDLDDASIEILSSLVEGLAPNSYLFSDDGGVTPWKGVNVTRTHKRIRDRVCGTCGFFADKPEVDCPKCSTPVGVYFRVQDLRAWMTTFLLAAGHSKLAQNRGGWKDEVTMRKHYNRLNREGSAAALADINNHFGNGGAVAAS